MYNAVAFLSTLTMLCNDHLYLVPKHSPPPKKTPPPIKQLLPFPSPQPLATTSRLSISVDLPVLGISHKWNHIICDRCVWLLSLGIMLQRFVHTVAWMSVFPAGLPTCQLETAEPR